MLPQWMSPKKHSVRRTGPPRLAALIALDKTAAANKCLARNNKSRTKENARRLDGCLRDRPSLTALNKDRFRRGFTPDDVQRLEQLHELALKREQAVLKSLIVVIALVCTTTAAQAQETKLRSEFIDQYSFFGEWKVGSTKHITKVGDKPAKEKLNNCYLESSPLDDTVRFEFLPTRSSFPMSPSLKTRSW